MFEQLPPTAYPQSLYISTRLTPDEVADMVSASALCYPVAVKPDIGMMGFMFRKINCVEKLKEYHAKMPVNYIAQEFVSYPLEVSVFYYRLPYQEKGTITGFLKKEFLQVTGDGTSSLLDLITAYPRVRFRLDEMKAKHESRLNDILKAGEIFVLSNALNLSRGGRLVSLAHEKDDLLLGIFDQLSHYTKHFYYGRYDIKCLSIDDLKQGKNFYILEYNGCGAEPHHIYGNGHTLLQAYKIVLHHWKMLFRIAKYNNDRGIRYWKFREGWAFLKNAKRHFRMLKQLDASTEI